MIDRKNEHFLTRMQEARETIDNLKTAQPIGADVTEIRRADGLDPAFDADINPLNDGQRAYLSISFFPNVKEWQDSTYNEIRYLIYVMNPGDPSATLYKGEHINVLPTQKLDAYAAQVEVQIVNVSGVPKRILVRAYCLTTALSGSLNTSWYI